MGQIHLITGTTRVKVNGASSKLNPEQREGESSGTGWLWLAPLLVALLLSPTLLYPFARDQAVFTYVGKTLAEGGMPYRDAWDLKPPGIYLAYAALWRLSGEDAFRMMIVTRIADVLLASLTGMLLAVLGSRLRDRWAGITAAVWYAALYLQETYWGMAQAESWANPLLLLALLGLTHSEEPPNFTNVALAGLLLGAVACLKPTTLLAAAPFLFAFGARNGKVILGGRMLILLAACVAFSIGLSVAWLKAEGAWEAYVDIQQGFVAAYARLNAPDLWKRIENAVGYTLGWSRDHWAAVVLGIAGFAWGRQRVDERFLYRIGLALILAWLGVCFQNKYFGYHWQPVLPFLAMLAGAGTVTVIQRLYPLIDARWAVAAPVAWALSVSGGDIAAAVQRSFGAMTALEWNSRFGPPGGGDYSFEANRQAAEWLREHSRPGEKVLVWGFEPSIYLMADRQCPTRFFFNVPVAVRFTPNAWREEFLTTLRDNPPEWLIVTHNDPIPWANGRTDDSAAQLRDWPDLNRFVKTNYTFDTDSEDFRIYRRDGATSAPEIPD